MTPSASEGGPYGVLYLDAEELDLLRLVVTKVLFQVQSNKVAHGEEGPFVELTDYQRDRLGQLLGRVGDELLRVMGGGRG